MLLLVFDFDHTIVDGNTDTKVLDVLELEDQDPGLLELQNQFDETRGWTAYMKEIFELLAQRGVTKADMIRVLHNMQLTAGMTQLFQFIRDNKQHIEVMIVSDSNTWFIDLLLQHLAIQDVVDEVHTNPAHWTTTDNNQQLLHLSRYTTNEACARCPINLCKGEVLRTTHQHRHYTNTVYVGDGGNDLCPVLDLAQTDIGCARQGYRLAKKLQKLEEGAQCKIVVWEDGREIIPHLAELLK